MNASGRGNIDDMSYVKAYNSIHMLNMRHRAPPGASTWYYCLVLLGGDGVILYLNSAHFMRVCVP